MVVRGTARPTDVPASKVALHASPHVLVAGESLATTPIEKIRKTL